MAVINEKMEDDLRSQTCLLDEKDKLMALYHIFHPNLSWSCYLICFRTYYDENIIFSLIHTNEVEFGFVELDKINTQKINDKHFEIDNSFKPILANKLLEKLKKNLFI